MSTELREQRWKAELEEKRRRGGKDDDGYDTPSDDDETHARPLAINAPPPTQPFDPRNPFNNAQQPQQIPPIRVEQPQTGSAPPSQSYNSTLPGQSPNLPIPGIGSRPPPPQQVTGNPPIPDIQIEPDAGNSNYADNV